MIIANYHTHTCRCAHASRDADEVYIQKAIESGLSVLGFADHTPWPYDNGFTNHGVRMYVEELPDYIESLSALREKYRDQIRIYIGLECEFFPKYLPWLKETAQRIDYLILGNHYALSDEFGGLNYGGTRTASDLRDYIRYTMRGMESGLYRYLAHPDIMLAEYGAFDADAEIGSRLLCETAKELNLPLEYNLYGMAKGETGSTKGLGYPCRQFWEIAAETGCAAIIGFDAHWPDHLLRMDLYRKAAEQLDAMGIRRLETLEGLE